MVPATSKKLKMKFQDNPITFPMVKRKSFRFIEPCNWNIIDTKRVLKITSVAVD
jgi:hypothetical protein